MTPELRPPESGIHLNAPDLPVDVVDLAGQSLDHQPVQLDVLPVVAGPAEAGDVAAFGGDGHV